MNNWFILIILILFSSLGFAQNITPDGPFILTDFNFDKTYFEPQLIDFYCWPSNDVPANCIKETYYEIDGISYNYNFGDFALIDFNGTKEIIVYAENDLGAISNKTFILTINKEETKPVNNQINSNAAPSHNYNSSEVELPIQIISQPTESKDEDNDKIIEEVLIENDYVKDELTLNNINEESEAHLEIKIERGEREVSIAGLFTLGAVDLGKNSIYILLVTIIIILSIAVIIAGKDRK